MSFSQLFVILVVVIPLGLATFNRIRIDIAALLMAFSLGTAQFLGLAVLGPADTPDVASRAMSGLGRPEVIVLVGLFIIMHALERTGVARWIARRLLQIGGQSERRLIALFTVTAAILSLFMNNVAVGALLLPSAMDAARRTTMKPSKLLMPIAFGTALGGMATYFTTANIVISALLPVAAPPQEPLGILDFTPTGAIIALAGILYLVVLGKRLLPDRASLNEQLMPRYTSTELEEMYQLEERLWEAQVLPGSPLSGKTLAQTGIGGRFGLTVIAIWHDRHAILVPSPEQPIAHGDILLIVGREDRIEQLREEKLKIGRTSENGHISARSVALVEAVLAPHSHIEGRTFKDLEFRKKYGFTAVALWRDGRSYRTDVGDFKLRLGDSYLMVGPRERLKQLQNNPDFIVLEPDVSDQPISTHQALWAVTIMIGAVIASVLGFPIYLAMLGGAVMVVLSNLLPLEEIYRAIHWQAIFLIAGIYSVSLAMVETGLAEKIGNSIVQIGAPFGSLGLAVACFMLAAIFTQVMSSQVTALVIGPIAISAAIHLNTNPQAIAVAAAMGCSASFLTPMAHPVNLLIMGPANYKFSDFFRLGWGLMIVCSAALVLGMVFFWDL